MAAVTLAGAAYLGPQIKALSGEPKMWLHNISPNQIKDGKGNLQRNSLLQSASKHAVNTTTSPPRPRRIPVNHASKHTHVGIELFCCHSIISLADIWSAGFAVLLSKCLDSSRMILSSQSLTGHDTETPSLHYVPYRTTAGNVTTTSQLDF